jgi:hypothetical protein
VPIVPPPPGTFIVGNDQGVREVGYDGATVRVIATTPARRLRLVAGGKAVVFYVRATGEIHELSLATGVDRKVAALPNGFKACGHMPDYQSGHRFAVANLDVQADDDFVFDGSGNAVCMTLMDRNVNMANVAIDVRVDLASGAVLHRVTRGGECAAKPPNWKDCAARATDGAKWAPFRSAAGIDEELVSPSGRWSVLSMNDDRGDYIHRSLFLLDRQGDQVFPIVKGPFPAPIPLAALARTEDRAATVDAVGESVVRWLDHDALLVDSLLVVPERGGVDIDGDAAL